MSDGTRRIPAAELAHTLNHTHITTVCIINEDHMNLEGGNRLVVTDEVHDFYNLMPGIYTLVIDGMEYYIDVYLALLGGSYLHVDNKNTVYMIAGLNKYILIPYIYRRGASIGMEYLTCTVNSELDMVYIDGKTTITHEPSIENPAKMGSLYKFSIITGKAIDDIKELQSNPDYDPNDIFERDPDPKDELVIYLKNDIKSLPNGVKDHMVLNAFQKQHHIIYNVGREYIDGGEDWRFIEDLSNSDTLLFYWHTTNVKVQDYGNNLYCTHFPTLAYNEIIKPTCVDTGIATSGDPDNPGIYIRLPDNTFEYDHEGPLVPFRRWLIQQVDYQNLPEFPEEPEPDAPPATCPVCGEPMTYPEEHKHPEVIHSGQIILDYPLAETIYRTVYLDEYHAKTFFKNTAVKILEDVAISYFYKSWRYIEILDEFAVRPKNDIMPSTPELYLPEWTKPKEELEADGSEIIYNYTKDTNADE